jgi:hypothetical protein
MIQREYIDTRAVRKVTLGELLTGQVVRKISYYIQKMCTYLSYIST